MIFPNVRLLAIETGGRWSRWTLVQAWPGQVRPSSCRKTQYQKQTNGLVYLRCVSLLVCGGFLNLRHGVMFWFFDAWFVCLVFWLGVWLARWWYYVFFLLFFCFCCRCCCNARNTFGTLGKFWNRQAKSNTPSLECLEQCWGNQYQLRSITFFCAVLQMG